MHHNNRGAPQKAYCYSPSFSAFTACCQDPALVHTGLQEGEAGLSCCLLHMQPSREGNSTQNILKEANTKVPSVMGHRSSVRRIASGHKHVLERQLPCIGLDRDPDTWTLPFNTCFRHVHPALLWTSSLHALTGMT